MYECVPFFQVCLRIRPLNEDEILLGATCIAHKVEDRVRNSLILSVRACHLINKELSKKHLNFLNVKNIFLVVHYCRIEPFFYSPNEVRGKANLHT